MTDRQVRVGPEPQVDRSGVCAGCVERAVAAIREKYELSPKGMGVATFIEAEHKAGRL